MFITIIHQNSQEADDEKRTVHPDNRRKRRGSTRCFGSHFRQGIALERDALVTPAIKAGKLVKVFSLSIRETVNGYYFVFPENHLNNPKIQAFLSWIKKA